ncbi:MAG: hypothetical protein Q8P41_02755 [Pseudomonadota bacterium]|nr:hypothetical protein [Pseudomonadota bacterium]
MASIRRVVPQSAPNAVSTVPEGTVLALKIARPDDKLAEDAIAREVETFVALSRAPGSPPCPRLYDIIGSPVTGLVMEWCPTDMERWWEATWAAPRSFLDLTEALADICRRVREYEAVAELELGKRVIHADIKPRNVLRAVDGRWLLTDFGASKFRSVDDSSWAATRMILGTENFIAPEALFNARKPHPAAMDTWSLGCSFFALLRMRTVLRGGAKMPANGTHAHLFRTNRVALIGDLQQRKPALFVDKDLDPAQFPSPEKLPEKDRRAVAEAMEGVLGARNPTLEGVLVTETLHLLDRALRIDPALRFRDPLEMAGEFEALAQRFRELALRADGGVGSGRIAGGSGTGSAGTAAGPAHAAGSGKVGSGMGGSGSAPAANANAGSGLAASGHGAPAVGAAVDSSRAGASAPRVLVSEDIVVEDGSGRKGVAATPPVATASTVARVPPWIGVALLAVLGLQVVQIGVAIAALAIALRSPAPAPASLPPPGPLAAASAPTAASPFAELVEPRAPDVTTGTSAVGIGVEVAAEPVASAPAAPAPPKPPASTPPPPSSSDVVPKRIGTPPPVGGGAGASGLILVSGGQAYLLGPNGRMPTGSVAPGSYELWVQTRPEGEFQSQGMVPVSGGDRIVYKCGLGTCRRLP